MSLGNGDHPTPPAPPWQIELTGSEIARVEQVGSDLVLMLAAARVSGDRRQLDPGLSGGHLLGVRWRLIQASWTGVPANLIGRIDEADWREDPSPSMLAGLALRVPSSGDRAMQLRLTTALGDTLTVQAQAWQIDWMADGRFAPSLAC